MPASQKWLPKLRRNLSSIWERIRLQQTAESVMPFQVNRDWFVGGASMIAGYILGTINTPLWLAIVVLVGFLVSAAAWPWLEKTTGRKTVFWSCFLLFFAVVVVLVWKESNRSVEARITPYVVVHRPTKRPGMKLNSSYGFSVVTQVRNTTTSPKQIERLEVSGDIEAEFGDYAGAITRDGITIDEEAEEYKRVRPYRTLHWIANPVESGFVEAGSTKYMKFTFLKPENWGMRVIPGEQAKRDYFGSVNGGTKPQTPTTSIHLWDLIRFETLRDYGEIVEWVGPEFREELHRKTFFTLIVDGVALPIQKGNVNRIVWTLEPHWKDESTPNLFWGLSGSSSDRLRP